MGIVRTEIKVRVNADDEALLPIRMANRLEAIRTAEIILLHGAAAKTKAECFVERGLFHHRPSSFEKNIIMTSLSSS